MASSEEQPKRRPATIKAIAALCGLSKSTVSYALQSDPRIRPETRRRVLDAARELDYDPAAHEAARRLVASQGGRPYLNRLVAAFFPSGILGVDAYHARMAAGVMDVLAEECFGVLLNYLPTGPGHAPVFPPVFRRGEVDGVIAGASAILAPDTLRALRSIRAFAQRPVISLVWRHPGCAAVVVDDRQAGEAVGEHLLGLGHRRIAVMVWPGLGGWVLAPDETTAAPPEARLLGLRQAVLRRGLDPGQVLVPYEMDPAWLDPGRLPANESLGHLASGSSAADHPLVELLRRDRGITAIVARNDPAARWAWATLAAAGLRVPDDVSIVGSDDTMPVFDDAGRNALTTLRLPLEALGREAARLMLRCLSTSEDHEAEVVLGAELVVRRSTAPPRPRH